MLPTIRGRIDTISTQAKAGWDQFEADMSRTFSELEREVDAAVR